MLIRVLAAITLLAAVSIWQVPQGRGMFLQFSNRRFHSFGKVRSLAESVAMGDADGKVIQSDDFSLARKSRLRGRRRPTKAISNR